MVGRRDTAQSVNQTLIKNLFHCKKPIAFINAENERIFNLEDNVPFKNNPEDFIKNGKDLYVFINGTGRLYKVDTAANICRFVRVDSTSHFGYNIAAFPFSFNNNIYNLGGYGLWRINGQLRKYNEDARQWDIVKLNQEIPFLEEHNSLIWYDVQNQKIYVGYYVERNEAVKTDVTETKFVYNVMVLDLIKDEWSKVGNLNSYLKNNLPITSNVAFTPWGQLVSMGDKYVLIDYKNNQVLTLDAAKQGYQSFQRDMANSCFYFEDSTLFYGSISGDRLDSIPFRYSDFKPTGEPVFIATSKFSLYRFLILPLFAILVAVIAVYFFLKRFTFSISRKKVTQINNVIAEKENVNIVSTRQLFDEKEMQVLSLLYKNSAKGQPTNIDELNRILGLTKKTMEIQKKQRSDTIISINQKYLFFTQKEELLIEKKRMEFDKRSFEYFITYEKLKDLEPMLEIHTRNISK